MPDLPPAPLYGAPAIHRLLYPLDDEDRAFFGPLAGAGERVLDLGAGDGALAHFLGGRGAAAVALDLSAAMLSSAPAPLQRVRGDILSLPFADASFHTLTCRLFGISYAAGAWVAEGGGLDSLSAELARVLGPGGMLAMETPLAHDPAELAGIGEGLTIGEGAGALEYAFDYLDALAHSAWGAVLDTRIQVSGAGGAWELRAPLMVFTPTGIEAWLARGGFAAPTYCASYDRASETPRPPRDCLRAVVLARRAQRA